MKKLIAIVTLLTLALGLFGCAAAGGDPTVDTSAPNIDGLFSVGYARVNITPTYSIPLGGYGNTDKRMSTGFYDYQYTTCIAITDAENNTVLLYHNDLISTHEGTMTAVKSNIEMTTGIPAENIQVGSTHNHSSVDPGSRLPSVLTYNQELVAWMTEAAVAALRDRKPAEMYITTTEVEGVGFTRHFIMDDGSICGDNFSGTGTTVVDYYNKADTNLQLIKFVRQGGADVVLANFQSHPHSGGGSKKTYITSDMIGSFRDKIEAETGCLFAYFTGASGNVNSASRYLKENEAASDYITRGQLLADYAIAAIPTYEKVETGKVQLLSTSFEGKVNHDEDWKVAEARKVQAVWLATNNGTTAIAAADPSYNIKSPYHANGIISKLALGETVTFDHINAFSIGDVAFIAAPGELYHQLGTMVKEGSPFKMTFIVTCANASYGYVPSEDAYDYFPYECCTSKFQRGEGEKMMDVYLDLLNQLYPTR